MNENGFRAVIDGGDGVGSLRLNAYPGRLLFVAGLDDRTSAERRTAYFRPRCEQRGEPGLAYAGRGL